MGSPPPPRDGARGGPPRAAGGGVGATPPRRPPRRPRHGAPRGPRRRARPVGPRGCRARRGSAPWHRRRGDTRALRPRAGTAVPRGRADGGLGGLSAGLLLEVLKVDEQRRGEEQLA